MDAEQISEQLMKEKQAIGIATLYRYLKQHESSEVVLQA
ncbi:MAG: Fe2+ or Zn2+ uptake regulation protein [Enterobacterales bacterium]|jgi:Fe2+ or Zn2+ uptake regulation protein